MRTVIAAGRIVNREWVEVLLADELVEMSCARLRDDLDRFGDEGTDPQEANPVELGEGEV